MRIAIPASTNTINASIDERFGRCPFFCIYDAGTGTHLFIENIHKESGGGVGPQVVEFLATQGITEIYAKEVGPKAEKILEKLGIKVNSPGSHHTIKQMLEMLHPKFTNYAFRK